MLKDFFSQFRSGTRSLKTALALYFIPISVCPTIFISIYATRVFEESTNETLVRRAASERDAIVAEVDALESELLEQGRVQAQSPNLTAATQRRDSTALKQALAAFRPNLQLRVYTLDGTFLADRKIPGLENQIAYLSKEGLRRVKARGETMERYFSEDASGFITVARALIKDRRQAVGVLEMEYFFGQRDLQDLRARRQVDVLLLTRDFTAVAASFALSQEVIRSFSRLGLQPGFRSQKEGVFVTVGDNRFATFLYDMPSGLGKLKKWGYLAVFLPMTNVDATVNRLKWAIIYSTVLLTLVAMLLIFIFSKRLVKPIEVLVSAMKRVKTGRVEQIPNIDSPYEIEYLVQSFNEMTRNVSAAKRALELKLGELRRANQEIKDTQGHLVQSAKMISLGQIVAGVAHELNNPIAFIYSNMHHLFDYLGKFKELVKAYRKLQSLLPPEAKRDIVSLEEALEIDFILKDMEDLTRSCVEGANRVKEIVLGLRTFSRMDESTFQMADLHEGLRSTIKLLSTEFKDKVTIHEEFGTLPGVECSISQINQVFMNLLSNAAQAIAGRGEIWIRTRQEEDMAVIEIEDNGSGMSPDTLEKIFDPFFTTKKVGQGTGLGLSIAYGLVQKHGGTIEVSSQVGRGTHFSIRLPLRQSVAQVG